MKCKHVRRYGESCRKNNNCEYPSCQANNMEDLREALSVIEKYENMKFDEFVSLFEKCYGQVDETTKEDWRFTGLANRDFFRAYAPDKSDNLVIEK